MALTLPTYKYPLGFSLDLPEDWSVTAETDRASDPVAAAQVLFETHYPLWLGQLPESIQVVVEELAKLDDTQLEPKPTSRQKPALATVWTLQGDNRSDTEENRIVDPGAAVVTDGHTARGVDNDDVEPSRPSAPSGSNIPDDHVDDPDALARVAATIASTMRKRRAWYAALELHPAGPWERAVLWLPTTDETLPPDSQLPADGRNIHVCGAFDHRSRDRAPTSLDTELARHGVIHLQIYDPHAPARHHDLYFEPERQWLCVKEPPLPGQPLPVAPDADRRGQAKRLRWKHFLQSDLASWFGLTEIRRSGRGHQHTIVELKPGGFQEFIDLAVVLHGDDDIVGLSLSIDRGWLDRGRADQANGVDLVKSVLGWLGTADPVLDHLGQQLEAGLAQIVHVAASNHNQPAPDPALTAPLCLVFSSESGWALIRGTRPLMLGNFAPSAHERWFRLAWGDLALLGYLS